MTFEERLEEVESLVSRYEEFATGMRERIEHARGVIARAVESRRDDRIAEAWDLLEMVVPSGVTLPKPKTEPVAEAKVEAKVEAETPAEVPAEAPVKTKKTTKATKAKK